MADQPLSDAEVFGTQAAAPAQPAPLSDAEVFSGSHDAGPSPVVPGDAVSQQMFQDSNAGKLYNAQQGNWFTRPFMAAGGAAKDAVMDGGRLGLSDESIKKLEDLGVYGKYQDNWLDGVRAINNGIIQVAAVTADAAMRTINAGAKGAAAFVEEGTQQGDVNTTVEESGRDVDAMFMMSGMSELGIPAAARIAQPGELRTILSAPALGEKAEAATADAATMTSMPAAKSEPVLTAPVKSEAIDEKTGNLNLDYISESPDVKSLMGTVSQAYADENGVVISHAQTVDEAQKFMDDAVSETADGIPGSMANYMRGDPMNKVMFYSSRQYVQQATRDAWLATQKVVATGAPTDMTAALAADDRMMQMTGIRHEITAEAGRTLESGKIPVGDEEGADFEALAEKMSGMTQEERIRLMSSFDSPDAIAKFVRDVKKPTWADMGIFYVINNYLSGPLTHAAYTASWAVQTVIRAGIETPIASAVGRVQTALGKTLEPAEIKALQTEREGIASRLAEADSTQGRPLKASESVALTKRADEITKQLSQSVTVMPGEAAARFYGIGQGAMDSIRAAGRSLRTGNIQMLPGEMVAAKNAAKEAVDKAMTEGKSADEAKRLGEAAYNKAAIYSNNPILDRISQSPLLQNNPIAKALANAAGIAVGIPTRVIAGIHSLQKFSGFAESSNALAYRQAVSEGLTSEEDIGARIAQIKNNMPPEMIRQSAEEAKYAALMGKPGAFGQKIEDLAHVNGWTRMIVPFSRVVTNLANQKYLERTPLGLLSPVIRSNLMGANGNAAQATQIAKMLTGSTLLAGGAWLAAQGHNNGAPADKPNDRAMQYLEGRPPYTVRIGNVNIPHRMFGVPGGSLSLGADVYDIMQKTQSDHDAWAIMGNTVHVLGNDMLQENALKGAADLYDAIRNNEPDAAKKYVLNAVTAAATPYSVGLNQTTRMIDPIMRSTAGDDFWDRFKKSEESHIPWESSGLLPKVDIFGRPMQRGGDFTAAMNDPVIQTLQRLGVSPAPVGARLFNVKLNDQQHFDYATKAGGIFYHNMQNLVNSEDWTKLDAETQADMVHTAIKESRKDAKDYMCLSYSNISPNAAKYCGKLTGQPGE